MKSRLATITATVAVAFFMMSVSACHRRPAEGPVQKTKEVVKDVGHDVKETGRDIKNDVKK